MAPYLIWFLIGVGFLLAELALPGFIVIFFCVGSWAASLTSVFTSSLEIQIAVFTVVSIVSLFTLRKVFLRTFTGQLKDGIDEDIADSKIGKTALVTKRITPHVDGEIKFSGSFWRATADVDIEEGASVTIVSKASGDGLTFKVKPLGGGI